MKTHHAHQSGFTLLELLVVVAIIAVLAALLFPVFTRIQEKARIATCVSNLKQLHTAAVSYASEHGGHLPHTASEEYVWLGAEGVAGSGYRKGWVDWWPEWDSSNPPDEDQRQTCWWNQDGWKGVASVTNGTLFGYLGDAGDESAYVCPTMQRVARRRFGGGSDQMELVTRSYGMNASLQNWIWPQRYYEIDGPSRTMMFAEQGFIQQSDYDYALESADTGDNWEDPEIPDDTSPGDRYIRRSYRNYDGCIDWRGSQDWSPCGGGDTTYEHIGEYHDGRGNCVFCDGHVERIRYQGTQYISSGNWEDGRYFRNNRWYDRQELRNE